MRILASLLLVSTLVLGVHALASGEDGEAVLKQRIESLELQMEYALSREAALTAYVLRNGDRANALDQLVSTMRQQGFTKRAIPPISRESLLGGLAGMAADLRKDLPALDKDQQVLLKRIEAGKKK